MNKKKIFNIIAVIGIIILCFAATPVTLQNDTYYTVAIGEKIVQSGIDMQDPFSWHDLSYTYPHWLYDLLTYFVYQLGGFSGIYIATILLSCILGVTIYFTNVKLSKNNIVSFLITVCVIYMIQSYIAARAQLVTFILFALSVFFIERYLESKKKRFGVALILISLLIANLHVAVWPFFFVIFLPYIAEYLIVSIRDNPILLYILRKNKKNKLNRLKKRGSAETELSKLEAELEKIEKAIERFNIRQAEKNAKAPYKVIAEKNPAIKGLIIIMLICVMMGLITPIGDTPYTYLYKTMKGNTTSNINEHLPLTLINNDNAIVSISVLIILLTFVNTKIKLRDLFMIGGLVLLTFMSKRQFSMFLIIGSFIFNRLICQAFDKDNNGVTDKLTEKCVSEFGKIAFILIMAAGSWFVYKDKIDDGIINPKTYPVGASDYIVNNLDLNRMKIFNEYNYGSYMLYRKIPVFIDSRADLYAPEFNGKNDIFTDFLDITGLSVEYETKFEEYGVTHVILYKSSKLSTFLSKDTNYKIVYSDDNFIVYERLTSDYEK